MIFPSRRELVVAFKKFVSDENITLRILLEPQRLVDVLLRHRFVHFLVVGGGGVALALGITWVGTKFILGLENYFTAYLIGTAVGLVFNFTLYSIVIFKTSHEHVRRLTVYLVYMLVVIAAQAGMVKTITPFVGLKWYLLVIAAVIFFFSIINFLVFKLALFKERSGVRVEARGTIREGYAIIVFIVFWTLLMLCAMFPYVFFEYLIVPGADAIGQYYPGMYWYAGVLRDGESFLWDPQIFSGFPTYLSQISGYIEPLNFFLFSSLHSAVDAYHIRLVIDCVLVMLFSYLAARKWGISVLASFFVGPVYLMSFHWWYLSNTVIMNSLFALPFLFWVYRAAGDAGKLRTRLLWGVLGGVGVGWAFLGGYAQFVVYALLFVGLYAIAEFFLVTPGRDRTLRRAIELSIVLTLFACIGFLIGSPLILAAMAYAPLSVRSGGVEYALTQFKVLEPQELVYLFFPDYLRFPLLTGGKKTLFIGVLSLLLAVTALLHIKKQKLIPILAGLFVFAFVMAVPNSPLFYAFHQLPVFDLFRFPYRWMYLGIWVLALLSAVGFDMMREEASKKTRILAYVALLLVSSTTLFVIACTFFGEWFWGPLKDLGRWLFVEFAYEETAFPKGIDHYHGAIERGVDALRSVTSLTNMQFAIPMISLILSGLVFAARSFGHISWRQFQIASSVVIVATFIGIFVARWPDSLPSDVFNEHERSAGRVILEKDLVQYRVHPFNLGESFFERVPSTLAWNTENVLAGSEMQFATGGPNDHRFAGYSITDGYDVFVARDLLLTLAVLGSNYASEAEVGSLSINERKQRLLAHLDVVGMMSGRYLITGGELHHPDLTLLAKPTASRYNVPYYIYEYNKAQPRVRLATHFTSHPHKTLMELIEGGKSFSATDYLDCVDCRATHSAKSTVVINEIGNGYFNLEIVAQNDELLIVSEQFVPGWKAKLDGVLVTPRRVNGMYMAFKIPEGKHRLILQYEGVRGEAGWLYDLGLFPRPPLER